MPKNRSPFPAYPKKPHKTGQARVKLRGRDVYLGVWDSPESRAEYARRAAEFASGQPSAAPPPTRDGLTVAEVIARWIVFAKEEYKGRPEGRNFGRPLTVLDRLFGPTPAAAFDSERLETVQLAMASGSWQNDAERARLKKHRQSPGWCRNIVNRNVTRIRTVWRWAERKGLVPKGSWENLRTLPGLSKKSGRVRHTKQRREVTWEQVKAVLEVVAPPVAAMLELQWHSGMRPSEVARMRVGDVDQAGPEGFWLYILKGHKNAWRDGEDECEAVVLGLECQRVLKPWLEAARSRGEDAYVFCPSRRRKNKLYTKNTYAQAVRRACDQLGVPRWTPYAIRHAAKQRITRLCGLDHARAMLRQRSLGTTNDYGKQVDLHLQVEAAKKTG